MTKSNRNPLFAWLVVLPVFVMSSCRPSSEPKSISSSNPNKGHNEKVDSTDLVPKESILSKNDTRVSILLENSGSMDGYLSVNSEFKHVINQIARNAELLFPVETYYINTNKYPSQRTLSEFLLNLSPKGIGAGSKVYGDRRSSNLNIMFNKAVEVAKRSGVSILISDGIYSLQGISEIEKLKEVLNSEKLKTRNTLIESIEGTDLQTHLIQLYSNYNGRYYTVSNKNFNINNKKRPYYIWIFGNGEKVQEVLNEIKPTELPGYRNSANFFIIPKSGFKYSILPTGPGIMGEFQRSDYKSGFIHEIEDTDPSRTNNRFGFNMVIDLKSHLPLDGDFLNDIGNYEVISQQQAYSISRIVSVVDFDPRTITSLKALNKVDFTPSHNFYLEADGRLRLGKIQVNLKYNTPRWINESSTYDDSKYNTKTMGFALLMDAFIEAYSKLNDTEYLATTQLKVNK